MELLIILHPILLALAYKSTYKLAKMIFYNSFYYTSRIISAIEDIWFFPSNIQKEKIYQFEGNLEKVYKNIKY